MRTLLTLNFETGSQTERREANAQLTSTPPVPYFLVGWLVTVTRSGNQPTTDEQGATNQPTGSESSTWLVATPQAAPPKYGVTGGMAHTFDPF